MVKYIINKQALGRGAWLLAVLFFAMPARLYHFIVHTKGKGKRKIKEVLRRKEEEKGKGIFKSISAMPSVREWFLRCRVINVPLHNGVFKRMTRNKAITPDAPLVRREQDKALILSDFCVTLKSILCYRAVYHSAQPPVKSIACGGLFFFLIFFAMPAFPAPLIVSCTSYSYNEPTNITATGKHVNPHYVAVSRSLERLFPMHALIKINGKVYRVEDRMSAKWKHHRVDIFLKSKKASDKFGLQKCKVEKMKK